VKVRYSRWDGSQKEFTLDADKALDALSDLMMHGLNAREAMQYMQQFGFDLAGQDFRVMGQKELMQELRKRARELLDRYDMSETTKGLRERFESLLGEEENAVKERHGYESRKMNDFLDRRHAQAPRLSDAIERFSDYEFEDDDAAEAYEELKNELERLRQLEDFLKQAQQHFRGKTKADYETGQQVREQMQALQQMLRALQEGKFENVDPAQLAELLGENAQRSLIMLRDLESTLRDRGYLRTRDGEDELTPTAVRRIGASALASVYANLRKGRQGGHETVAQGVASPRPDETRPYQFGDALDVDSSAMRSTSTWSRACSTRCGAKAATSWKGGAGRAGCGSASTTSRCARRISRRRPRPCCCSTCPGRCHSRTASPPPSAWRSPCTS
jgi:uncharacterized protein with von Willebrand factor type A (vWA) domain